MNLNRTTSAIPSRRLAVARIRATLGSARAPAVLGLGLSCSRAIRGHPAVDGVPPDLTRARDDLNLAASITLSAIVPELPRQQIFQRQLPDPRLRNVKDPGGLRCGYPIGCRGFRAWSWTSTLDSDGCWPGTRWRCPSRISLEFVPCATPRISAASACVMASGLVGFLGVIVAIISAVVRKSPNGPPRGSSESTASLME